MIMAENSKLTNIEVNGIRYVLGKSIYDELGISLERFAELLGRDLYCPTLSAAPTSYTLTYTDTDGETQHFQVGQSCRWIEEGEYRLAICKNVSASTIAWYVLPVKVSELTNDKGYLTSHQDISHLATKTELSGKQDTISDLATIRSNASKGATALQSIPSEYVTESELTAKGYATSAQVSNAQTAAQDYADRKVAALVNGAPSTLDTLDELAAALKDNADIVDVLNGSISNKQDKVLKFTNVVASKWVADTTQEGYEFRCDMTTVGVDETMYPDVVFSTADATSGNYAPIARTGNNMVSIWSKESVTTTVLTILITK